MSREQKIAKARELRGKGEAYEAIADAVGAGVSTVYRWLNPARTAPYKNGRACNANKARAYDRQRHAARKKPCPRCGQKMQPSSTLCLRCREDDADQTARTVVQLWADGQTMGEIAKRLGWSVELLGVYIHRWRSRGYELPYRYEHHARAPRFPDQVAA